MPYIYSTLSCDVAYSIYAKGGEIPIRTDCFLVKGGANMAISGKNGALYTPRGMVTEISDEKLAAIEKDPCFQAHMKNGFIVVEKYKIGTDSIAGGMAKKDKSAPKTPADYPEKPTDKSAAPEKK